MDEDAVLGQVSVSRATTGTLTLGVVYDSLNSQVARFRDANVYVDVVVLEKRRTYAH